MMQIEQAINEARKMHLRSARQGEIVSALIHHLEAQMATVRNQRKQLSDMNAQRLTLKLTTNDETAFIVHEDGSVTPGTPPSPGAGLLQFATTEVKEGGLVIGTPLPHDGPPGK